MDGQKFEWGRQKEAANRKKHGVTFAEAKTAFFDENAPVIADPNHSEEQNRFILLGLSSQLRLLVVCHCYREDQGTVRIISARKASRTERREFEGFRHA